MLRAPQNAPNSAARACCSSLDLGGRLPKPHPQAPHRQATQKFDVLTRPHIRSERGLRILRLDAACIELSPLPLEPGSSVILEVIVVSATPQPFRWVWCQQFLDKHAACLRTAGICASYVPAQMRVSMDTFPLNQTRSQMGH